MKKFAALLTTLFLICTCVCGAPVGMHSVPTDIRVFMYGVEIPSVCVNNSMYIPAENLSGFGFAVNYDNSVRTLFISKVTDDITAQDIHENVTVKNTLETDINVILNGETVPKNDTFAYDGKMWLNVSAICRYRDGNNYSDVGNPGYPHFLTKVWDGENRAVNIENSPLPSAKEQRDLLLSYNGNRENYSTFLAFTEESYPGEGFEVVSLRVGGLPHGAQTYWYYVADNGKAYSINTVTAPFAFYSYWGNCTITGGRVEGNRFYFKAQRMLTREPVVKTVSGEYYLDLETTVTHIISEKEG